jgi:hypothetical protein
MTCLRSSATGFGRLIKDLLKKNKIKWEWKNRKKTIFIYTCMFIFSVDSDQMKIHLFHFPEFVRIQSISFIIKTNGKYSLLFNLSNENVMKFDELKSPTVLHQKQLNGVRIEFSNIPKIRLLIIIKIFKHNNYNYKIACPTCLA